MGIKWKSRAKKEDLIQTMALWNGCPWGRVHQAGFRMAFAFISSLWFILSLESNLISSCSKPIISTPKLHGMTSYCKFFLVVSYLYSVVRFPHSLPRCFKITTFLKTKTIALQMFHLTQLFHVQFLVCQARLSLKLCPQSWVCSALLCLWNVLPSVPQI